MPSDLLTSFLIELSPEPTKEKKIWCEKVSDFIECYNKYVDAVRGNQDLDHEVMWNQFKELIENRSQNYSVHY